MLPRTALQRGICPPGTLVKRSARLATENPTQYSRGTLTRGSGDCMAYWTRVALACIVCALIATLSWKSRSAAPQNNITAARDYAIQAIEERQGPEGYWTTSYTPLPVFHDPGTQLDNFLAPIMIDLLHPVADRMNLAAALERARAYTESQIDDRGVVQFHPLVNPILKTAPSCTHITPDADDTALAWTLARKPNSDRLADALQILRSFQTEDGLFRTWLSDEKDFQCLVPGVDPNPPDIGINLHV
jgi:hypothetical protein